MLLVVLSWKTTIASDIYSIRDLIALIWYAFQNGVFELAATRYTWLQLLFETRKPHNLGNCLTYIKHIICIAHKYSIFLNIAGLAISFAWNSEIWSFSRGHMPSLIADSVIIMLQTSAINIYDPTYAVGTVNPCSRYRIWVYPGHIYRQTEIILATSIIWKKNQCAALTFLRFYYNYVRFW